MAILNSITSTSVPYWDGGRVLFEIIDGNGYIPCAISRMALEEISEKNCFKKADLPVCFASARERIEKLAAAKLEARADGIAGWFQETPRPCPRRRHAVDPTVPPKFREEFKT